MKRLVFALTAALLISFPLAARGPAADLPTKLSDTDFWKLSADLSEPGGRFQSDNILSNELSFQTIIPDLQKIVKPGVYMGVGPEQNFTYIAALKPKMVFITDVRRGNLHMHLMYKALFEMSKDRADFVGMLFSKKRPAGLTADSSVNEIFTKYDAAPISEDVYKDTWAKIINHLTKSPHTFVLDKFDVDGIKYVFDHFYAFGTAINYRDSLGGNGFGGGRGGGNYATYESLMLTNDGTGTQRAFLANNENFKFMQDLETRNMLVPLTGNFAGPKALRAVGQYIRDHGETVQAFYLSNVEDYLNTADQPWMNFCNSVASLPLTESSTFIYGARGQGGGGFGGGLLSWYRPMMKDVKDNGCKAH